MVGGASARRDSARFRAVALSCLSVSPAIALTAAFFLARLPPADRDDCPDWAPPSSPALAPWLLLFLHPPLMTGLFSRLIGGRDSFSRFWHYAAICSHVAVPFIGLSAQSSLGKEHSHWGAGVTDYCPRAWLQLVRGLSADVCVDPPDDR